MQAIITVSEFTTRTKIYTNLNKNYKFKKEIKHYVIKSPLESCITFVYRRIVLPLLKQYQNPHRWSIPGSNRLENLRVWDTLKKINK